MKYKVGQKVTGIRDGQTYEILMKSSWFPKYHKDIMTITGISMGDAYTVKENSCKWMDGWLIPVEDSNFLESELFEL